jgi:2-(1,2-epoxy-1,2-dihydrophenyl)acetyl-CoA isomerase
MSGLRLDRAKSIARITFDRPASGNCLDLAGAQALLKAAIACDEDPEIRCVILTGEGKYFCLGGDVSSFAAAGEGLAPLIKEITAALHAAIARLASMNKALITQINGTAAGAGMSLAILGDFAFAARSASFSMAYSGLGYTPDGGVTWFLPRLVGMRQAQRLALRKTKIDAAEAERIGLISEAVDDDQLAARVEEVAAEMVASAPSSVGPTRALLLSSFQTSLETQMDLESRSIAAASKTVHGREGLAAFLGKRAPDFSK